MDFLIAMTLISHGIGFGLDSYGQEVGYSDAYCQNLYWQRDAEQKMLEYGCDIDAVSEEITRVRSGKY